MDTEKGINENPFDEEFLEEVRFGRVHCDMETSLYLQYKEELFAVNSIMQLIMHCNKWGKFSPDLNTVAFMLQESDWDLFVNLRETSWGNNPKPPGPNLPSEWCSLIVPSHFIPIGNIARRFHISDGLALMRMFHAGLAEITKNGMLRIKNWSPENWYEE